MSKMAEGQPPGVVGNAANVVRSSTVLPELQEVYGSSSVHSEYRIKDEKLKKYSYKEGLSKFAFLKRNLKASQLFACTTGAVTFSRNYRVHFALCDCCIVATVLLNSLNHIPLFLGTLSSLDEDIIYDESERFLVVGYVSYLLCTTGCVSSSRLPFVSEPGLL
jgi:hypothetical protein